MANKRRPQGDGTIRKRNDGRWEARIIIGHKHDGSPMYKSAFTKTQKSALKQLHQLIDLYRKLKIILKHAGLPLIRFHDLRHTFATHATHGGVDPKTLAGILGHTNASFTLDTYTHVTSDMQKAASNIVGNIMQNIMIKE